MIAIILLFVASHQCLIPQMLMIFKTSPIWTNLTVSNLTEAPPQVIYDWLVQRDNFQNKNSLMTRRTEMEFFFLGDPQTPKKAGSPPQPPLDSHLGDL